MVSLARAGVVVASIPWVMLRADLDLLKAAGGVVTVTVKEQAGMVVAIRRRLAHDDAVQPNHGEARDALTSSARAQGVSNEHIVQLTGLTPNTKYFYSVGAVPLTPPAADKKGADAEDAPGRAAPTSPRSSR